LNYPLLALDAALGRASAVLLMPDGTSLAAESEGDRSHSRTLVPMLENLLGQADIGWHDLRMLALGVGPGSFTGLRIAAATFAGINASLSLPVLSISSLAITAAQAGTDDELWVLEDARSGEVFVGHYQDNQAVEDDRCMGWEALQQVAASKYVSVATPPVVLSGWQQLDRPINRTEAMAGVVKNALCHTEISELPRYVQPAYLQVSQAERNLQ